MGGIGGLGGVSGVGGIMTPQLSVQLDGAILWVAADQIEGVADGGVVTTWSDLSGDGNDMVAAEDDTRPTYHLNQMNSLPVVRFEGSEDRMVATLATERAQPNSTYAVIAKLSDSAGNEQMISGANEANSNSHVFYHRASSNAFYYYSGAEISGLAEDTDDHVFAAVWNGASSILETDGNVHSADAGANALHKIVFGSSQTPDEYADCEIAEFLVFDVAHTQAQFDIISAYLAAKWGITLA